ncbi:MAG: condensation domain-containing protein, partial [Xenococcaceae cyanobacterium]
MNLSEFIKDLLSQGIELWVDGERLRYRAPKELLKPTLLTKIKQHKIEILQLLQQQDYVCKVYPLSQNQRGLWFLHQLAPESAAYNLALPLRICSPIDIPALQGALQTLIARHPALRTRFTTKEAEPMQEVYAYQELCFEEIDASSWTEDELAQRVVQAYQRPFDLQQGSMLRVSLFTCSAQEYIFLLTIHHIVSDFASLWVLMEELQVLYPAYKCSEQASIPPLSVSYADYVRQQEEILASSQGEQLWNYWQKQLAGDLPLLNLPTDFPRPSVQTFRGASHKFKLDEQLTQKLKKLAQENGVTLYTLLLASFQVLLYRYTNQEDILVGSPISNRMQDGFAGIVGDLVNPVVLRGNLSGNPTFTAFLTQVRQMVLDAIAHQDYPFALLVERLQPQRDLSYSPLFQVIFNLQKPQQSQEVVDLLLADKGTQVDGGGLKLELFEMAQQEGQFDLSLEILEGKQALMGVFKYNTDLFAPTTITQMVGHFQTLLEGILTNPEQRIFYLPLLTTAEKHQLLVEWNNTQADYPQDKCIHQLFEEQVEKTPDAVAVVFEDQQLTYGELNTRANQLAHYLRKLGVEPEVLVGICVERSVEMVVGLLGILKAGGAYVPLDPNYPNERLSYMLADSGVEVLLTQQSLLESLPQNQAQMVCLDSDWGTIEQQSQENLDVKVHSDNLAYVIYTSGSTGVPKGVLVEHKNVA